MEAVLDAGPDRRRGAGDAGDLTPANGRGERRSRRGGGDGRHRLPTRPYRLVYDGACGLCRPLADEARRRGRSRDLEVFPFQDRSRLLPTGVPAERARESLYLVAPDGRRWSGAQAVTRLMLVLPGAWLTAAGRLLSLPALRRVAEAGYRWVARNRGRIASATGLHRPPRRPHES